MLRVTGKVSHFMAPLFAHDGHSPFKGSKLDFITYYGL